MSSLRTSHITFVFQRSEKDLLNYLERHPLVTPTEASQAVAVLVSDSKAARLEAVRKDSSTPLIFLYKKGARTKQLVELLRSELPKILSQHQKTAIVYFWSGTCDITRKNKKYIEVRKTGSKVPDSIYEQFIRARDFVLSLNCRIKFIGLPIYLVSLYNDIRGHPYPVEFLDQDEEVEEQVNKVNDHIVALNQELSRHTLKFNADLRDNRHKNKKYFFELLEDGLHPGELLSTKWLRRLELDIVSECYATADTIVIDQQEYLAFEKEEGGKNGF